MKFRIKKEDGFYYAEYKRNFWWHFIPDSVSRNIENTREACKKFEEPRIVEVFRL